MIDPTRLCATLFLSIGAVMAQSALAAELHVPAQFPTIHEAIMAAEEGDEVIVAPGTYSRTGAPIWTSVDTGGKSITVRSSDGAAVTILDGAGAQIVRLTMGEAPETLLKGFTLRNGGGQSGRGGAVYLNGSGLTVSGCVFENNAANIGGAAAHEGGSVATYIDCVFKNNSGIVGGAVANFDSEATYTDCEFESNTTMHPSAQAEGGAASNRNSVVEYRRCEFRGNASENVGGALDVRIGSSVALVDCVVENNESTRGGGVYSALDSAFSAVNTRFLGNRANEFGGGVHSTFNESLTLVNCEFSGNQSGLLVGRRGGGVYAQNHTGEVRIVNCTFANNTTRTTLGAGIASTFDASLVISNTIVWGNLTRFGIDDVDPTLTETGQIHILDATSTDIAHSIIDQFENTPGVALSGADPLLIDPAGSDGVFGTIDDDNRPGPGSPAIDAGNNTLLPNDDFDIDEDGDTMEQIPLDLAGNPRRMDDPDVPDTGVGDAPIVDIGAYEAPGDVAKPCPGDTNGDNVVDFADLSAVLSDFGQTGVGIPGDVNGDGEVDFADLSIVLGAFGTVCD
ncbi:MAG: hypothetical protein EA379_03160 [Phycisphaerales bacterium]|nr:MAG: hypothetical protein EA379_03160 [Phycisphaerales bacterium]